MTQIWEGQRETDRVSPFFAHLPGAQGQELGVIIDSLASCLIDMYYPYFKFLASACLVLCASGFPLSKSFIIEQPLIFVLSNI